MELKVLQAGWPPRAVLLPALVLAMVSALCVSLVIGEVLAVRAVGMAAAPARVAAPPSAAATAAAVELTALASSELFGHYDPSTPAAGESPAAAAETSTLVAQDLAGEGPPDSLPEASLALRLQGILYDDDPADRRAIIAGEGTQVEARRIGDTLRGAAVIRFIEARRVVVEQQGELQALSLPELELNAGGLPGAPRGIYGVSNRRGVAPPAAAQVYQVPPMEMIEAEPAEPEDLPLDDETMEDYDPSELDTEIPDADMDAGDYQ